jgi:hypothetical protein
MNNHYNKESITKLVLKQLPLESRDYNNLTLEQIIFRWWETGRSGSSLRLRDEGDQCFKLAGITYYEYAFSYKLKEFKHPKLFALKLQRKIKCPFYIGVKTINGKNNQPYIHIYDDKLALLIGLFGSIEDYLESEVKV